MFRQEPSEPATLHAWHVPPHAPSQHTPSAHVPLLQCDGVPSQAAPNANFNRHVPPPQNFPALHSESCAHPPPPVGAQEDCPLHVAPGQLPSGSVPAGCAVHAPALPGSAQDSQVPVQAELQHTPSAHSPDWHSVPEAQASPAVPGETHAPPAHRNPTLQSASRAHVVAQVPALHW